MARRLRRNQEFRLTEPVTAPQALRSGIRGLTILGIVVNPRNHIPVLVATDGTFVGIRSLQEAGLLNKHGTGYYDTDNYGRSHEAQELTGLPRCHTPDGVTPRGAGYGTCLYTGLALGAFLQNVGDAEIEMSEKGNGVCSEQENRSREADAWWNAAHQRKLTGRDEIEGETEREEDVDLEVPAEDLNAYVDEGEVTYVNRVNVDIEKQGESLQVDWYRYDDAEEANLVVVAFEDPSEIGGRQVPEDIRSGTELKWMVEAITNENDRYELKFKQTNQVALLGIDVRGLDVQAVNLIALAYMAAELGDKEVDALYYRWKHNLDPGSEVKQLSLSEARIPVRWDLLTPNQKREGGLADVVEARRQADWARLEMLP